MHLFHRIQQMNDSATVVECLISMRVGKFFANLFFEDILDRIGSRFQLSNHISLCSSSLSRSQSEIEMWTREMDEDLLPV